MTRAMSRMVLAGAIVCSTAVMSLAQQTSSATETKTFEVLAVEGNQLVVRLPEGTRELTVPSDFRFNIDGQQMSVQQLKPGMKGTANITTRTTVTPVTVTEVKNGTVVQSSGSSVIVRTPEGYRNFSQGELEKRGVRIYRNGKPVGNLMELSKGDQLTATIVTTKPPQVLTEKEVQATLARAPAPAAAAPAPAAAAPPPAAAAPPPASAPMAAPTRTLPSTASSWPALGLASVLYLAMGLALTVRRRFAC